MAVNALDPTKPVLSDQSIELVEELRAIKQRLVADKSNIEQLQQTLVNISGITAFGAELLASADADAALDLLEFTSVGKQLAGIPTLPDLIELLGIESPVPGLVIGGSNKWTILFAGTIKIQILVASVPSGGATVTWAEPFTNVAGAWGAVASIFQNTATQPAWTRDHDATGCFLDHANGSTQSCCVIAIGQ
jgi:hypothetical protein